MCDSWKRRVGLSWPTTDDPYHSDSDCEELDARSYKVTTSHSHTNTQQQQRLSLFREFFHSPCLTAFIDDGLFK